MSIFEDLMEEENLKNIVVLVMFEANKLSTEVRDSILISLKEFFKNAMTPQEIEENFNNLPEKEQIIIIDKTEKKILDKLFKKESELFKEIEEKSKNLTVEELLKLTILLLYKINAYTKEGKLEDRIEDIEKRKRRHLDYEDIYG